ncbi:competence type IV pilus major pilin ComGC [Loigolactobacillus rennini]|uniref:Competence protein ComGC n=2 Tax=Loigolactobacillus rennini TaxID=238013 RepID=A0A0R2CMT2_9LACO|nr:competence type IV pilus major pilin ComGC [Loigolactobacillus rennini]KRM92856.1 hypothetical protein FC24_GL000872 [Loigolactobacillus rennini DSM 20253]SFZ87702.1 Late competence protein ComGC, access of DNA to ComEA, FIG007487 [Loigolactobacillus rennini]
MLKKQLVTKNAFTLIEMVVVLFIITLLILIILPNVGAQRKKAQSTGDEAFVSTVETQRELYQNAHGGGTPTLNQLKSEGYLTQRQYKRAKQIASLNP